MNHGLEHQYIIKDHKRLRFGYTTGSCAAAAAQAAAKLLFSGEIPAAVRLATPKGLVLFLEPVEAAREENGAQCAIRKDAGDDPDVTDGLLIFARVQKCSRETAVSCLKKYGWEKDAGEREAVIALEGGAGIGTVTLPGLEQPVGAPAINRVPRKMIRKEVQSVCRESGYTEGILVTVSAPGGETLAEKTFNPRLGIVGGISILGTSGIVEPMSERALVATIETEMRQKAADREYLLVTPGNYGTDYLKGNFPFAPEEAVKCSNYVGQTIDLAVNLGLKGILFVAHIGKFVKVAGGIMNTHSRSGDSRAELLAANAIRAGISLEGAREILDTITTDEALAVIRRENLLEPVMEELTKRILYYMNHRTYDRMLLGAVIFSNEYGYLGQTENTEELIRLLQKQYKKPSV